jgi:hypothetical protein
MVSCGPRRHNGAPMHLVVMAWLFVIGTMALTSASVLGGLAFFAGAGVAPVAFYAWIKLRRLRAMRGAGRSVRQQRVDGRDDADARGDQQ